jgi:hypothetical protein
MTTYIWPEGGGGSGGDPNRFAPKYIVGNIPAGDDPTYTFAGGFIYIADPGDGTGIEAALSQASLAPGDVWIRPGTYDFGTGAVAMPLTIPAGTRVQGSGDTTILRARAAGDQGVFVLAAPAAVPPDPLGGPSHSQLRDMRIEGPAAAGAGTGSAALVLVRGSGCILGSLSISYSTDAASTLRSGILVNTAGNSPIPPTSIESVLVSVEAGTTIQAGNLDATSCFAMTEGQVSVRNVTALSGDIGFELRNTRGLLASGGCVLLGADVYALNSQQYGVFATELDDTLNSTGVRINNAVFQGSVDAPPPLGLGTRTAARIEASFLTTFRSAVCILWDTGFDVDPGAVSLTNTASIQIDDSQVVFATLGVRFGRGTVASSVSDTDIGPAFAGSPVTCAQGVLVQGAGPGAATSGISLTNNMIRVADYTAAGVQSFGVSADFVDGCFIEGNEITHDEVGGILNGSHSILVVDSTDVTVADNVVVSTSNVGAIGVLDSTSTRPASRTTITGNTVSMPTASRPPYGLEIQAGRCTITGNAINQIAYTAGGSAAAIFVAGSEGAPATRCTITGNTIQPSAAGAAPAIAIGGDENTCMSNVCSLPTPPATAAIVVAGSNNVAVGNVCRTVPPVSDTGIGNEVAHNI